jgi:hypothetical protein
LIDNLVGYDTIPTNSLVISPGHGTHLILLCIYQPLIILQMITDLVHSNKVTTNDTTTLPGSMSNNHFLHFV